MTQSEPTTLKIRLNLKNLNKDPLVNHKNSTHTEMKKTHRKRKHHKKRTNNDYFPNKNHHGYRQDKGSASDTSSSSHYTDEDYSGTSRKRQSAYTAVVPTTTGTNSHSLLLETEPYKRNMHWTSERVETTKLILRAVVS